MGVVQVEHQSDVGRETCVAVIEFRGLNAVVWRPTRRIVDGNQRPPALTQLRGIRSESDRLEREIVRA